MKLIKIQHTLGSQKNELTTNRNHDNVEMKFLKETAKKTKTHKQKLAKKEECKYAVLVNKKKL